MATNERKVDPSAYPDILARRRGGESLGPIAASYGVTRERIRQIIAREAPGLQEEIQRQKERGWAKQRAVKAQEREREQWAKLHRAMERALKQDRRCLVCGAWVIRPRGKECCSSECSEAWMTIRFLDEYEKHRREVARAYLRTPELYKPSMLSWAEAVLSDDPPPPNRRFFVPGSRAEHFARKYRPKIYRAITGEAP